MSASRRLPALRRAWFLLVLPITLAADIVTWDVSDLDLVTPPSYGDSTNFGNTAIGVWLNLYSGEAYIVDDAAGVPGLTDLSDGRFQLRLNLYWRDNDDGLPSTEVIVQGAVATTRLLGTSTAQPNAAVGSPARLDAGVEVPTGTDFQPASFIEMAGTFGVWQELGRGFLAVYVRHPTLPQFHYGYLDVTLLEDGRIRLNGFAYNDVPNETLTTAYIGAPAPAAATGLTVTSQTATTISLAWTDNAGTETGFKIQRKGPGEDEFATVGTAPADAIAYSDEGLAASSTYTYRVIATTGLDADPSNAVSATTSAVTGPPAAPSDVLAMPRSPTSLELSWTDNATDEVGYRIERREGSDDFALLTTTGPSATSFLDAGLLPGKSYTYRLTATNGLDSSPVMSASTATFSSRETTGAEATALTHPEITGNGVVVGLWDFAPARSTHTEFAGEAGSRVTNIQGGEAGSDPLSNHTTHAAGLIAARGADPSSAGIAPEAEVHVYDYTDDIDEFLSTGMEWPAQANRLQIGSASYGPIRGWNPTSGGAVKWLFNVPEEAGEPLAFDPNFGAYSNYSQAVDEALAQRPYFLLVRSAGNDRDDGPATGDLVYLSSEAASDFTASVYDPSIHPLGDGLDNGGYGLVSDAAAAKNTLAVGAIFGARRDATTGELLFAGAETDFSNWGPTTDGRVKPDLVAPGVHLRSAGYASDDAYATLTGSSQAAPQVAGVAALLVDAWSQAGAQAALRASTLKGLLIHTADDLAAPGPDPHTGWGLVNARAAIDVITRHLAAPSEGLLREGALSASHSGDTLTIRTDGSTELRATLAWTDPAADSAGSTPTALINDLELRLVDAHGTVFEPFVLPIANPLTDVNDPGAPAETGPNSVDPVEQIRIAAPEGEYTLSISVNGTLATAEQAYSLILTGGDASPHAPGPKPIESNVAASGVLEIMGGDFALGTAVALEGPEGATTPLEGVEVMPARIRLRYTSEAVVDGTWFVILTQPDGRSARLRWPVGSSAPRGYEDWLQSHFSALDRANANLTWYGADADGDGIPLLAAYALGASSGAVPENRKPSLSTVETAGEYRGEVTYTRLIGADVAIIVEVADDLAGPWTPLSAADEVEVIDLGDGTEQVRVRDSKDLVGAAQTRFLRIRVDWE